MGLWKIIDRGQVDQTKATMIQRTCSNCGAESGLPVNGLVIAELAGGGLVFDGPVKFPAKIRCPECDSTFEMQ